MQKSNIIEKQKKQDRNFTIVILKKAGFTNAEISRKVDVSSERVAQILFLKGFSRRSRSAATFVCSICGKTKRVVGNKTSDVSFENTCISCARKRREKRWSKFFDQCRECKETKVAHKQEGYCSKCWAKLQYKNNPVYRARSIASSRKWLKNNIEERRKTMSAYAKEYYKKNKAKILAKAKNKKRL